ncbi:SpoIIE family protein phosphatase [Sphaerisporangium sp. NPDC005289]|uniref:SpoIIE family protein phosphatase n=1 Tax=Sphaerisporangium sp. NPDC005289 TaxID=3155247 RepID=UPI0033A6DBAA
MLIGAALSRAVRDMDAYSGAVYLPDDEGRHLAATVICGAPPAIFTMPDRMSVDGPYATAMAYRTGRPVSVGATDASFPAARLLPLVPFAYSVVAVPLIAEESPIGTLTVAWVPPRRHRLPDAEMLRLRGMGASLSRDLARLGERGASIRANRPPVVMPLYDGVAQEREWGLPGIPGSFGMSLMYQVYKLSAMLNEASGLPEIIHAAEQRVMAPFGACCFALATIAEGRLRLAGQTGCQVGLAEEIHDVPLTRSTPYTDVIRNRDPLFFTGDDVLSSDYPSTTAGGLQSMAVLPIGPSAAPVGTLILGFDRPRRFGAGERAVLLMMTSQLGLATERARLGENERALAQGLQKRLLPRTLAELPQVVTTARYLSAPTSAGVGGDWYDAFCLPGGRIALIVGDVEGHNIDSAVIMGQLRSALRAYAAEGHSPAGVLARSSALLADLDTDLLATCCVVRIDPEAGVAEVALAGHPVPLVCGPDGVVTVPDVPPNVPLGVPLDGAHRTAEIPLSQGSLLMLYTDGLAQSATGDPVLGARDLLASVEEPGDASLERLADRLIAVAPDHEVRRDDIAVLLARYEGDPCGERRRIDRMAIQRHDLQGVGAARRFVRRHLREWGLDELSDDLEVMASEMVTNALIHADSDVEVRLREYPDRVHLEVRDTDPHPAVPSPITASEETNAVAEHGRGLIIVGRLATTWGNSPSGRGKTVWLDLDTGHGAGSPCFGPRRRVGPDAADDDRRQVTRPGGEGARS